jgi:hypothetical protein
VETQLPPLQSVRLATSPFDWRQIMLFGPNYACLWCIEACLDAAVIIPR